MARLFGTNGVRGLVGTTMTPTLALELGMAVGTWVGPGRRVGIGRDARATGPMLAQAFTAGLQAVGVHAVDLGVAPSPALQLYVRDRKLDAGAIVTASHNPPEWNGIKLVAPDGTETSRDEEERVEDILTHRSWTMAPWDKVGTSDRDDGAADHYVDAVAAQVDEDVIRKAGLTVVLDPGGGAGCVTSPRLLERLGVEVVRLSCDLDGAFADRPSEPTLENAARCMAAVRESGADLGILHDGDADRSVFVDERGDYVWGDQALALAARYELERHERRIVVTGVSSSTCVADVARMAGGGVVWTQVGSPIIARRMISEGAPFGGEDNGGLLFGRHQYCRDALMAAAFMLELLARTGRRFSALVADLPHYALRKSKVVVEDDAKEPILRAMRASTGTLDAREVDVQDGVKAYFDDGWFLVRPSGTEAIFRIQAEGRDEEEAARLADRARAWLDGLRQSVKT